MKWEDTFVLMPTWWGKSICFQLPAIALPWVTIVISPLIALMKDQVDNLQTNGIPAAFINSSVDYKQINAIEHQIVKWEIKILYIAPERLALNNFQTFLQAIDVSLIAIDEAHCISEWWHDFRPDYHNLSIFKQIFPNTPIIALTATATDKVKKDIVNKLSLKKPNTFVSSFDRPNLSLQVVAKRGSFKKLTKLLDKHKDESAIVYCFSRKDTEKIADKLQDRWYNAASYHAGLSPKKRKENQELFIKDKINIIVATIAFGMGIDKPDVRLVVHNSFPKTLEGYYQEIWRAGRDGLPSDCVLFYSWWDKRKHDFFIDDTDDLEEKEKAEKKLQEIIQYCELRSCRRKHLLKYFWEKSEDCGNCDICTTQNDTFDATEISQKILSAIFRTWNCFGANYITEVLRGSKQQAVLRNMHDQLSVYGIVKDFSKDELKHIIKSLTEKKLIKQESGKFPTLSVSIEGMEWLKSRGKIKLIQPPREEESFAKKKIDTSNFDRKLFDRLRKLRKEIAESRWVPPFMIFPDTALQQMSVSFPVTNEDFLGISGVGEQKLVQFGEQFLWEIGEYKESHNITPKANSINKSQTQYNNSARNSSTSRNKKKTQKNKISSNAIKTRKLLEEWKSIEEIAKIEWFAIWTIIKHIDILIINWKKCNLAHIEIKKESVQEIQDSFNKHQNEWLKVIFDDLWWKYDYDTIRLAKCIVTNDTLE